MFDRARGRQVAQQEVAELVDIVLLILDSSVELATPIRPQSKLNLDSHIRLTNAQTIPCFGFRV